MRPRPLRERAATYGSPYFTTLAASSSRSLALAVASTVPAIFRHQLGLDERNRLS